MKIKNAPQKSKRKLLLIIGLAVLLLAGAGVAAYFLTRPAPSTDQQPATDSSQQDTNVDTNPPTDDQKGAGDKIKEDSVQQDQNTTTKTVGVSVTAIERHDRDGDKVLVQTNIQRVSNKGTCTLTVKQANEENTYTAGIQPVSNYSTCEGFTLTNLTPGVWHLTLQYRDGTELKGSDSTEITI